MTCPIVRQYNHLKNKQEEHLTPKELGAALGSIKTDKKAAASRENGKLGGWKGTGGVKPVEEIPCTCGNGVPPHKASCRISRTLYQRQRRADGKR